MEIEVIQEERRREMGHRSQEVREIMILSIQMEKEQILIINNHQLFPRVPTERVLKAHRNKD